MATFSLADFFAGLAMVSVTAELDSDTSADETGGGVLNRASYGTRLWGGTVTIAPSYHADADAIAAKIQYLQDADVTFRVSPAWKLQAPVSTGVVTGINISDRRKVAISPGLTEGAIFGIVAANGMRSMHRVATLSGPTHFVIPALPYAMAPNDIVTYGQPEIDAYLVTASLPTYRPVIADGAAFQWRQTY